MNFALLLLAATLSSRKVDVTVGCCPLVVATKEAAARYHGMQFAAGSAPQKREADGAIRPNDPVWSKLEETAFHVNGTATVDHGELVLDFPGGPDVSRLKVWVDQNAEGTMSSELASALKLNPAHTTLNGKASDARRAQMVPAASGGGTQIRIPLQK